MPERSNRFTLKRRFQYFFDNLMSGGLIPILIILLLIAILITLIFSSVVYIAGISDEPQSLNRPFIEVFWQSFMHVIDQGTITDKVNWVYRFFMLFLTIMGILLVSSLVGLITSRINIVVDNLRKGRSFILEKDHIVILGWSTKIFLIIEKLIQTHISESNTKLIIAILAENDKIKMEDDIKNRIKNSKHCRIICRTGNPSDMDDLEIINIHEAKSIVIISPDDGRSDAHIIKSIMVIVNHPNRKNPEKILEEGLYNIIAEIEDQFNYEIASLVGGDELTLTVSSEVIARIAVQTCLQSGLSIVYNMILEQGNSRIKFEQNERWAGKYFHDVVFEYENACVIGVFRTKRGLVILNPSGNTKINADDKLVIISRDNDIPKFLDRSEQEHLIQNEYIPDKVEIQNEPKKILILGWNNEIPTIIKELDEYLVQGSELFIVAEQSQALENLVQKAMPIRKIAVTIRNGDITDRKILNNLEISNFQHIIVLSCTLQYAPQEADALTLVTLMHLRQIKEENRANFSIVSEMLDIKNRVLAEIAKTDDFIVSDHLVSLLIAQLAENKDLQLIFDDLFKSVGNEFYLKPSSLYLNTTEPVNYLTLMQSGILRNEIVVGYRKMEFVNDASRNYGVILNPSKTSIVQISEDDKIIVLAKD